MVADRRCRPIARIISPGQHADSPYFRRVLQRVRIARRGLGRPRRRPRRVLADKAYSSRANRAYLRRRGIQAVIPIKKDQRANRLKQGRRGGRPPGFDRERYKERNTAERCITSAVRTSGGRMNVGLGLPMSGPAALLEWARRMPPGHERVGQQHQIVARFPGHRPGLFRSGAGWQKSALPESESAAVGLDGPAGDERGIV
ncbi:transposase [Streptosporangium subroseum]|nr:transposase [Streptosporangium subroseum]